VWHYLRDFAFSHFYTIPECDRHTHTHTDRHPTIAYTALSIASCGKNVFVFISVNGHLNLMARDFQSIQNFYHISELSHCYSCVLQVGSSLLMAALAVRWSATMPLFTHNRPIDGQAIE